MLTCAVSQALSQTTIGCHISSTNSCVESRFSLHVHVFMYINIIHVYMYTYNSCSVGKFKIYTFCSFVFFLLFLKCIFLLPGVTACTCIQAVPCYIHVHVCICAYTFMTVPTVMSFFMSHWMVCTLIQHLHIAGIIHRVS